MLFMNWKITFYNKKIETELLNWPNKLKAKLLKIFDLITVCGANLGMPITRSLGGGLFEIRVKAQEGIGRAFFCYIVKNEIMILHSFIKKTEKTPLPELNLAITRLNEIRLWNTNQ